MEYAKSIDEFFIKHNDRGEELEKLSTILLKTEMQETLKWGMPTYTLDGKNIVGIASFKNWTCLWFHHGGIMKDEDNVLINAQKGKTKALRQWRFTKLADIKTRQINKYIHEAIENHKNGKRVVLNTKPKKKSTKFLMPQILSDALKIDKILNQQFEKLTPAQKRDYAEYIDEPKREATKIARLDKALPLIKEKKPLAHLWKK